MKRNAIALAQRGNNEFGDGKQHEKGGYIQAVQETYRAKKTESVMRTHAWKVFFATLKKEKLYRLDTGKLAGEQVKAIVWRYVMVYYNRYRVSTVSKGGLPSAVYTMMTEQNRSVV